MDGGFGRQTNSVRWFHRKPFGKKAMLPARNRTFDGRPEQRVLGVSLKRYPGQDEQSY